MEKPFFWILIKKTPSLELLSEFTANQFNNIGIAIYYKIAEKTTPEILDLVQSTHKIPLAIFSTKKINPGSYNAGIFTTVIYPFGNTTSLEKSDFFSFKISNLAHKKNETDNIVEQLSQYFLYRGAFPDREAIFELGNLSTTVLDQRFYSLMHKLGIRMFLIPFSGRSIRTLKNDAFGSQPASVGKKSENAAAIDKWRKQIDNLDYALIDILKKRMGIVREMEKLKKQQNLPFFEAERWNEILVSRKKTAKALDVDEELIEKIFEAIHLNNLKLMLREND